MIEEQSAVGTNMELKINEENEIGEAIYEKLSLNICKWW